MNLMFYNNWAVKQLIKLLIFYIHINICWDKQPNQRNVVFILLNQTLLVSVWQNILIYSFGI